MGKIKTCKQELIGEYSDRQKSCTFCLEFFRDPHEEGGQFWNFFFEKSMINCFNCFDTCNVASVIKVRLNL